MGKGEMEEGRKELKKGGEEAARKWKMNEGRKEGEEEARNGQRKEGRRKKQGNDKEIKEGEQGMNEDR